jgi:hypothetical protein
VLAGLGCGFSRRGPGFEFRGVVLSGGPRDTNAPLLVAIYNLTPAPRPRIFASHDTERFLLDLQIFSPASSTARGVFLFLFPSI